MQSIRMHLESTVYKLAREVVCEGWALEMEYQLLKNWAQTIVRDCGGDWALWSIEVCGRIHELLELRS